MQFKGGYINCRYRTAAIKQDGNASINEQFQLNEFNNDIFQAEIDTAEGEDEIDISFKLELKKDIAVELLSVIYRIPNTGEIFALDRFYVRQRIQGGLWNNDLTPIHISYQYNDENWLIKNRTNFISHKIIPGKDHFDLELFLDAAGLHPQINYEGGVTKSSASQLKKAGRIYQLSFSIIKMRAEIYPVLNRFPKGYKAAFAITDHSDFDETQNLQRFLFGENGIGAWLQNSVRITKGVFARTGTKKKFNAATLEDKQYHDLIHELYDHGNEIAPHALNQSGQLTPSEFEATLDELQRSFAAASWIEHGSYLKYSYYLGGKSNEYALVDNLKKRSYSSIWSYHDVSVDPFRSLNLLDNTSAGAGASVLARKLFRGRFLQAGHIFRSNLMRHYHGQKSLSYALNILSASRGFMMAVAKRKDVKRLFRNFLQSFLRTNNATINHYLPYTREEIQNFSPVLFSEDCNSLSQLKPDDLLMYTTQEILHIADIYNERALQALADDKGIHIAHTYILNRLPYINGIFNKDGSLKKEWIDFVEVLSRYVKEGIIWNCNLAKMIAFYKHLVQLDIVYQSDRIIVTNNTNTDFKGLSFSIFTDKQSPEILWNGRPPVDKPIAGEEEHTFWGDVPAGATITITWQ